MDSIELGRRLRAAREARGLSQEAAGVAIGVPRTAVTQLEAGKREVSSLELTHLAELYWRPIAHFFEENIEVEGEEDVLVALHRVAPGLEQDPAVHAQVGRCLSLYRDGVTLKKMLGHSFRSGPPTYERDVPRDAGEAVRQGGKAARDERRRLNIGNDPIPDLAKLINDQEIWASSLALPDHMSGLFMHDASIGLAILVNASHSRGRKRFSYAHEYAHALMDRDHGKVTVSSISNSKKLVEKRANVFAASFLMPGDGVQEVLRNLGKGLPSRQEQMIYDVAGGGQTKVESRPPPRSQRLTYMDVVIVAQHFGVSYQAALYRLRNLGHVTYPEFAELRERENLGRQYLATQGRPDDIGKQEQQQGQDHLHAEIMQLTIEAYRREEISRGRLLELSKGLGIPGETLLELGEAARGK